MSKEKGKKRQNNSTCETSNIKFGKLDIVLHSYNSIPTIQSIYDSVPDLKTNTSNCNIIEQHKSVKPIQDINSSTIKQSYEIFPSCITPQFSTYYNTLEEPIDENMVICWWCRISCVRIQLSCFLPIQYDDIRKKHIKRGYFCCWECVKAFNFELNDIKAQFRSYLIQNICKKIYGIEKSRSIKYSPHWTILKKYGGTIEDTHFFENAQQTTLDLIGFTRDSVS